jgi:hypothetical protein
LDFVSQLRHNLLVAIAALYSPRKAWKAFVTTVGQLRGFVGRLGAADNNFQG